MENRNNSQLDCYDDHVQHNLSVIQLVFGYKFINYRTLQEALTHNSCGGSSGNGTLNGIMENAQLALETDINRAGIGIINEVENLHKASTAAISETKHSSFSYERMEFLGDAILDFIVVEKLFNALPEAQEGVLSESKAMIVENKSLAQESLRLRLYEIMYVKDGLLRRELEGLMNNVNVKLQEKFPLECPSKNAPLPSNVLVPLDDLSELVPTLNQHMIKLLADVVESIIGAIFVDSGYSYSITAAAVSKAIRLEQRVKDIQQLFTVIKLQLDVGKRTR